MAPCSRRRGAATLGEATALRVRHLDLLRDAVRVAESATEVEGRLEWGATKTYEAPEVRLPRFLVEALAAHLAGQPRDRDALVFTAPEGGPLWASAFRDRTYRPAVQAAGLPADLRIHDLRHSAASLAIRSGAGVKAVQELLGHATAAMTMDTYGHLFPDELESVAAWLDELHAAASGSPL